MQGQPISVMVKRLALPFAIIEEKKFDNHRKKFDSFGYNAAKMLDDTLHR